MNCNNPTKGKYNYKGVILCSNCFSLAQMCDRRAVKQCVQLLTVYRESLRVNLASGRLRPSTTIPDSSSKVTKLPGKEELGNVLKGVASILGEAATRSKDLEGVGRDRSK